MIDDNKLLLHLDNIKNKSPIVADIMLTNFCNNKCSYCRFKHKTTKYISYSDFITYVLKLKKLGVKGFILTGGGEPTLNPDFNLITKWLEENNLDYGINTNFVEYKECSPIYLKVSLDAWDKESYIKKRGIDKYDQVIDNIKSFIDYKIKNNLKTQIGIQCLVETAEDIKAFYLAHKDLNVSYISFRPVESNDGYYYKDCRHYREYTKIMPKLQELSSIDSRVKVSFKWNELETHFNECYGNFTQYALDWNGNVLVCCHRPNDIIGHILDDDIVKKINSYRIDMSKCDIPCRLTGVNKIVKYIEENKNLIDRNFI